MKSKLLALLLIVVAFISCNDDDYTPQIDYRQYIELKNANVRTAGLNVMSFKVDSHNRSSKDLLIDVNYQVYLNDSYYFNYKLERVRLNSGEQKELNQIINLPHFTYQVFQVKNLNVDVIKVY